MAETLDDGEAVGEFGEFIRDAVHGFTGNPGIDHLGRQLEWVHALSVPNMSSPNQRKPRGFERLVDV